MRTHIPENDGLHFEDVLERRLGLTKEVLSQKEKEYAQGGCRFHNFDAAAKTLGTTPEKALWGFFIKHFVSVQDMVLSGKVQPKSMIDEKIGDCINYLILLEGLMSRHRDLMLVPNGTVGQEASDE